MPSCAHPQDQPLKPLASAVVAREVQPGDTSPNESLQTSAPGDIPHQLTSPLHTLATTRLIHKGVLLFLS